MRDLPDQFVAYTLRKRSPKSKETDSHSSSLYDEYRLYSAVSVSSTTADDRIQRLWSALYNNITYTWSRMIMRSSDRVEAEEESILPPEIAAAVVGMCRRLFEGGDPEGSHRPYEVQEKHLISAWRTAPEKFRAAVIGMYMARSNHVLIQHHGSQKWITKPIVVRPAVDVAPNGKLALEIHACSQPNATPLDKSTYVLGISLEQNMDYLLWWSLIDKLTLQMTAICRLLEQSGRDHAHVAEAMAAANLTPEYFSASFEPLRHFASPARNAAASVRNMLELWARIANRGSLIKLAATAVYGEGYGEANAQLAKLLRKLEKPANKYLPSRIQRMERLLKHDLGHFVSAASSTEAAVKEDEELMSAVMAVSADEEPEIPAPELGRIQMLFRRMKECTSEFFGCFSSARNKKD